MGRTGRTSWKTAWVGLAAAAVVAGLIWGAFYYRDRLVSRTPAKPAPVTTAGTAAAPTLIYFADAEYTTLAPEPRELPAAASPEERVKQLVAALIAGPRDATHSPTLPPDCALESVFVRDRVALLNFDEKLNSRHFGTTGELYALNSLYRTVTANVEGVDGVVILIDGRMSQTLAGDGGHVAAGFPLYGELGRYVAPAPREKKP